MNKLVIFDLDGTLVDSRRDVAGSLLHGLLSVGGSAVSEKSLYKHIGRSLDTIYLDLLGDNDLDRAKEASAAYRKHFFDHCADQSTLYDGVRELIESIDDHVQTAVATNKRTFMADRVLEIFGLRDKFFSVIGAETLPHKPAPDMLLHIMNKADADSSQTLMVGDTPLDVMAGKAAGIATFGVRYGFGDPEAIEAAGPDRMIDHISQVKEWIND